MINDFDYVQRQENVGHIITILTFHWNRQNSLLFSCDVNCEYMPCKIHVQLNKVIDNTLLYGYIYRWSDMMNMDIDTNVE